MSCDFCSEYRYVERELLKVLKSDEHHTIVSDVRQLVETEAWNEKKMKANAGDRDRAVKCIRWLISEGALEPRFVAGVEEVVGDLIAEIEHREAVLAYARGEGPFPLKESHE